MPSPSIDRLEGLLTSEAVKPPCRVATTAAITLSGLQTVDGVALAAGDRVLVKNQASGLNNGIYTAGTGDWERALDFNGSLDAVGGTQLYVVEGSDNENSYWKVAGTGSKTVGTDSLTFTPALISDSASVNYAPESLSVEAMLTKLSANAIPGFREPPHANFDYLDRFPRVDGPGRIQTSKGCEASFRTKYAADIQAGTAWVDPINGSNSYDGTKAVWTGGAVGPYKTVAFAVKNAVPSLVVVRASPYPEAPSVQRTFEWANSESNSGKVKIIEIDGHVRFEAVGKQPVELTFTLNTGSTYSAPLAPAWQTSHAYVVDDLVVANNQVWICTAISATGMSAGAGTGPSGTLVAGVTVIDNEVQWQLATQVCAVLWNGRKLDGYDYPLTRQISVANVDSADLSWCVVNGSLSIRVGSTDISTILGDLEIIYSFDAFDETTLGHTEVYFHGTQVLWIVPPGASVDGHGVNLDCTDRTGERGGLYIDAGDAEDRRFRIFYPGSYCINVSESDFGFDGVDAYSGKGDNLHYGGSSNGLEVNCKSWRAGSVLTWGQHTPSLNASATHEDTNIARYGGDYQYAAGPTLADSVSGGDGKTWNVACIAANGTEVSNRYGIYGFNAIDIWCDNCHIFNEGEASINAFSVTTNIHVFSTTYLTTAGSGVVDNYVASNS